MEMSKLISLSCGKRTSALTFLPRLLVFSGLYIFHKEGNSQVRKDQTGSSSIFIWFMILTEWRRREASEVTMRCCQEYTGHASQCVCKTHSKIIWRTGRYWPVLNFSQTLLSLSGFGPTARSSWLHQPPRCDATIWADRQHARAEGRPTGHTHTRFIINSQLIDRILWKVIRYPTPLNLENTGSWFTCWKSIF